MTAEPDVIPVVDRGLGNSAYLVDLGDGQALAVDPSRDLRALQAAARRRSLRIAVAADTHLHADFLSGARQLAATGAHLLASADGKRQFRHTAVADGAEVDLGGLVLQALGTPGHTDEHLAYLLLDGARPVGVFTGGSLIVGGAARTDLVDPARTEELARAQYASLHRLLSLGDDVAVWPTHGAGSFCSAPRRADRTSTIGREKATNPLLQAPDEEAFAAALLGSLGSFPGYFLRLAEVNRRGPPILDDQPRPARIDVPTARSMLADSVQLVDVRPMPDFAAGHIRRALAIPLRDAFATWLGWLVNPDRPVLFVRNTDQDPDEIVWQALKVGVEQIVGELDGGLTAWKAAGHPVTTFPVATPDEPSARTVLDVRQDSEYAAGHLSGALHAELGALRDRLPPLPPGRISVMCAHGERAVTAASLLAQHGREDVTVLLGAPDEWAEHTGVALVTGR